MADNVGYTPGAGATIAADDIGGVLHQRVKIGIGGDGIATDVSSANPMPVDTGLSQPLTDSQLRAAAVPISNQSLTNLDTDLGALADAAATSDTGSFSVISFIKRAMQNWTTLLSRIPALVGGRIPVDGSGVTQPISGTVTANTGLSQPLTDAQLRASAVPVSAAALPLPSGASTETTLAALNTKTPAVGQTNMAGSRPVVIASDQSVIPVNQSGVSATGSLAALNATVALSLNGATGFAVDLRGTFSATVTFQASIDGTNWFNIPVLPAGSAANVATVTTATVAGAWMGNGNGCVQVRVIATAYTSGSVTVVIRAMQAAGMVYNLPSAQTTQVISGSVTATVASTTLAAATANIGYVGLQIPLIVADIASAALTTTTTTAAITPAFGCSYEINIPVTAVTGTSPTLDVSIEESDDSGTNWFKVYDFPRITSAGIYRSPKLPLTGNRVRYVQTVGGTTPSFTRAINRLQSSERISYVRQLIDRTIVLTTLNSTTPSINVQNCSNAQLVINIGTATTAPTLQLQGSDDNGLTWYPVGGTLLAVASSTVQITQNNLQSQLLRAIVTSAGATVVTGYVLVKAF